MDGRPGARRPGRPPKKHAHMKRIAAQFRIDAPAERISPLGEGFINDTFLVTTGQTRYILQRKNRHVFTDIPAMMRNIWGVTTHLKAKVREAGGDPLREVLTVIPTSDGSLYYLDDAGDYWTMALYIEGSVSYDAATSPALARCGGEGIGRFQRQLSDYREPLTDILPGFHNIRIRFQQWDDALARDAAGRRKSVPQEIEWIESRRTEMLRFWERVECGEIPTRVTHNDTKINNILFDRQGRVLCVIDLDTVLNAPCCNDFGDAIRTYANHGREDDEHTENVWLDKEMFRSFTAGYLSETESFLTPAERDSLPFSARYITYEQVLRFLMDYLNGDTYYKIRFPDHNLVRTRAQYALLQSIEANYDELCEIVATSAAR